MAEFAEAGFRTVAVARDRRYAGKDERDFIEHMYASNEIFVTGDAESVQWAIDNKPRHAGIVFVPQRVLTSEKEMISWMAVAVIRGATRDRRFRMRGRIAYAAHDGFRIIERDGSETLVFSWEWYRQSLAA